MKVNIYYEMISLINLVAIGAKLWRKDYSLDNEIVFSYGKILNQLRIWDKESVFDIRVQYEDKEGDVRVYATYRLPSGVCESKEFYLGPVLVEEKTWQDILLQIKEKCIYGIVMDINFLKTQFLSNITIAKNQLLDLIAWPLVSAVDFLGVGWKEMSQLGKDMLKRFVDNPKKFYVGRFDNASVLIEKTYNPASLEGLGREMEKANTRQVDEGAYTNFWLLPIRLIVLDPDMRNLFPGSFNKYLMDTIEFSGRFPMSPLHELNDQVPGSILTELSYNNVKEVEGMWWIKEEQEGILITGLNYYTFENKRSD